MVNIYIPYTARKEIASAVQSLISTKENSNGNKSVFTSSRNLGAPHWFLLNSRVITVEDINSQLMTSIVGSPPLDVLIRTSGTRRLSEFMTWQVISF